MVSIVIIRKGRYLVRGSWLFLNFEIFSKFWKNIFWNIRVDHFYRRNIGSETFQYVIKSLQSKLVEWTVFFFILEWHLSYLIFFSNNKCDLAYYSNFLFLEQNSIFLILNDASKYAQFKFFRYNEYCTDFLKTNF